MCEQNPCETIHERKQGLLRSPNPKQFAADLTDGRDKPFLDTDQNVPVPVAGFAFYRCTHERTGARRPTCLRVARNFPSEFLGQPDFNRGDRLAIPIQEEFEPYFRINRVRKSSGRSGFPSGAQAAEIHRDSSKRTGLSRTTRYVPLPVLCCHLLSVRCNL